MPKSTKEPYPLGDYRRANLLRLVWRFGFLHRPLTRLFKHCPHIFNEGKHSAVVVVKQSACLPSTLMIQVRIQLTPAVFSVKFVFKKKEYKQKRSRVGP